MMGLLWFSQGFSVTCKTIYRWIMKNCCFLSNMNVTWEKFNILRTGDTDLRFYITTVQDG